MVEQKQIKTPLSPLSSQTSQEKVILWVCYVALYGYMLLAKTMVLMLRAKKACVIMHLQWLRILRNIIFGNFWFLLLLRIFSPQFSHF